MAEPPPSREAVDESIADALAAFDEDVRAAWAQIRIEPALWRCSDPAAPREHFWVIAIEHDEVLWLNHADDGINRSPFATHGAFDRYTSDRTDLIDVLEWFAIAIAERRWPTLDTHALPGELAGPGTIHRRQPTYWELRTAAGVRYRVHFRDRRGDRFAAADYPGIALVTEHPLLALRDAPSGSLFFNGTPADPAAVAATLDATVRAVTDGWRALADYADLGRDVEVALRAGHGVLMTGPEPVCSAVAAALATAGVTTSTLGYAASSHRPCRALILGRSYLLAQEFAFERCAD
ncbi:MAG: hypothetical protein K8W52_28770 [Deltaproteobacteria bacterium]|nr:hypothetical protein [Deltaproteobacteria bacterium]